MGHLKKNLVQKEKKVCYPLTILNSIWIEYSLKYKVYIYTMEIGTGDHSF